MVVLVMKYRRQMVKWRWWRMLSHESCRMYSQVTFFTHLSPPLTHAIIYFPLISFWVWSNNICNGSQWSKQGRKPKGGKPLGGTHLTAYASVLSQWLLILDAVWDQKKKKATNIMSDPLILCVDPLRKILKFHITGCIVRNQQIWIKPSLHLSEFEKIIFSFIVQSQSWLWFSTFFPGLSLSLSLFFFKDMQITLTD